MASVTINGIEIDVPPGANVRVSNGDVFIDGELHEVSSSDEDNRPSSITFNVHGDAGSISIKSERPYDDGIAVNVQGGVQGNVDVAQGKVQCGNVSGSAEVRQGSISCENVGGDARVLQGSITAKEIQGSATVKMGKVNFQD